jgi:hypothetical protein
MLSLDFSNEIDLELYGAYFDPRLFDPASS